MYTKLTPEDVRAIYESKDSSLKLAARYGVAKSTILRIRSGQGWGWLIRGEQPRKQKSRLSDEQIREIAASKEPHSVLAKRYGVCRPYISEIKAGRCFSDITGIVPKPPRPPKMTAEDAQAIMHSTESNQVLAERYGITYKSVHRIRRRKRWKSATARIRPPKWDSKSLKLTREDVEAIYLSEESNQVLSKRYGITYKSVWRIKQGKRWRKVTAGLSRTRFKFETVMDLVLHRGKRAGRKPDPTIYVEIFISSERATTLAERHGLSVEYVNAIRSGRVMREITSRIVPNLSRRRVLDRTRRTIDLAA